MTSFWFKTTNLEQMQRFQFQLVFSVHIIRQGGHGPVASSDLRTSKMQNEMSDGSATNRDNVFDCMVLCLQCWHFLFFVTEYYSWMYQDFYVCSQARRWSTGVRRETLTRTLRFGHCRRTLERKAQDEERALEHHFLDGKTKTCQNMYI